MKKLSSQKDFTVPSVFTFIGIIIAVIALFNSFYGSSVHTLQLIGFWLVFKFLVSKLNNSFFQNDISLNEKILSVISNIIMYAITIPTILVLYFKTDIYESLTFACVFFAACLIKKEISSITSKEKTKDKENYYTIGIPSIVSIAYIIAPIVFDIFQVPTFLTTQYFTTILLVLSGILALLPIPTCSLGIFKTQDKCVFSLQILWIFSIIFMASFNIGFALLFFLTVYTATIPFSMYAYYK